MVRAPSCPCLPVAGVRAALRHFLRRLTAPAVHDYAASRPLAQCSVEILDAAIMGRDKWLGGELGDDGCVYGVPGSALRVLKVSPSDGVVETIGPELPGKFKWLRGIQVDGFIYGVPTNSERVLQISPASGTVELIGESFKGAWKWHGGVLCPVDSCVYAIPCNAESVLKIFPDGRIATIAEGSPVLKGRCKWYGGLLGGDGCIYGIPNCAESVLKIDPAKQEVSTIGPKFLQGGQKWHGGVVGKDGCIYGVPSHAEAVLKIDPMAQKVSTIGEPIDSGLWRPNGKYKYGGGIVAPSGAVYCFPSDADFVLKIVPETETVSLIGPRFEGHNKWQNGFVGRDGNVYAIPCNAPGVLQIVCATDGVTTIPIDMENPNLQDKWEGGVEANGDMYCMPQNAKKVLRIAPMR
ncbi:unnamed protein product [Symbiodinium natans]|uniref:Uncharacterized protein n=1 Tax=Symbiodinium natans TaxID=878477 RepID=A0A812MD47_9DINO|nr:unnamed protein product [Symbiodinium natans]